MVKVIEDINQILKFAFSFLGDQKFADANHESEEEFRKSFEKYLLKTKTYRTIGVYEQNELIGVFSFLILHEEKYIEMLVCLSRNHDAYLQMMDDLSYHFKGYECFFVFNPKNDLLKQLLKEHHAEFDTEQAKMDLKEVLDMIPSKNIIPYSETYEAQYKAIHIDEKRYWTAEKVLSCPERFHILLALDDEKIVGYIDIDMEHSNHINEPFDLYVSPKYRRKGYGRALLETAIRLNQPKGMMLHVDIDNIPAIHLYSSMGFVKDEFGSSVVARLIV